jgi:hypothetical protein
MEVTILILGALGSVASLASFGVMVWQLRQQLAKPAEVAGPPETASEVTESRDEG